MDKKLQVLKKVLSTAQEQDYKGYSKFDALNSPILHFLSFRIPLLRLIYTQVVKESPINLRPLFLVKKSRNPKGIAQFIRAYLFLYQKEGDTKYLAKAEELIDYLLNNKSKGYKNACWGYDYIWQSTLFLQKKYEPNAVVTTFVCEALVHAFRVTQNDKYLTEARSAVEWMISDLPVLEENEEERAIAYVCREVKSIVLNNQVFTGAAMLKVWKHTQEPELLKIATRQFNFTYNRRTEYNCWYYTYPSKNSHITHDNYHTGGILDSFLEYFEETGDDRYMDVYWKGLKYYEENLFEKDGAPRWMNDKKFPFDVHGSAQGIITFAKAAKHNKKYKKQAELYSEWAINNLYRESEKDFIYRQGRLMKWDYSLMRWCNSWMTRAIGELVTC